MLIINNIFGSITLKAINLTKLKLTILGSLGGVRKCPILPLMDMHVVYVFRNLVGRVFYFSTKLCTS